MAFSPNLVPARQADRKSIPGGFSVRPACCCTQAGKARQGRQAGKAEHSHYFWVVPALPCLFAAGQNQPTCNWAQHPRPTSLSPLNFSFQAKLLPGFSSKCFQILTWMSPLAGGWSWRRRSRRSRSWTSRRSKLRRQRQRLRRWENLIFDQDFQI